MAPAIIESIYKGQPKVLLDGRGEWISSIDRQRIDGTVEIGNGGMIGDRVTQSYHGGPDAAICVHLCDHYRFWKERYGMELKHSSVGENLVLDNITEDNVFAGDIVRAGTALLQVSGPRVPCANQARHVGRSDWIKLTIRENRTGFYTRVLEPGNVSRGDIWVLEQRLNEVASIAAMNRCIYLNFDPAFAQRAIALAGLGDWWKQQFQERLKSKGPHWTQAMSK